MRILRYRWCGLQKLSEHHLLSFAVRVSTIYHESACAFSPGIHRTRNNFTSTNFTLT
jgi:hypothetical protein